MKTLIGRAATDRASECLNRGSAFAARGIVEVVTDIPGRNDVDGNGRTLGDISQAR
ncbi:MAG: hypothetical protein H0T56_08075 [Pseudaminobacter sp.]|nr:hypothetical protein [Pseudaminobacter sp.]